MSRIYDRLECGCYISCDGGGGLAPCAYDESSPNCKAKEHIDKHKRCEVCGECLICYDHGDCVYKQKDLLFDMKLFIEDIIEEGQRLLIKVNSFLEEE